MDRPPRPASWLSLRAWPIVVSGTFILTGLLFTFLWGPVVHHLHAWIDSGDLWDTYRAAQWVGWGNEGSVYQHQIYALYFPLMAVLLAPVAMINQHFSLADPYPFYIAQPPALPLLITYVLLLSVVMLFAVDRALRSLDIRGGRRIAVLWITAVLLWPTVVMWGHPEEALCVSFILWALVAIRERRWVAVGWLMGFAVAFQPYALLLLPMVIGLAPGGQRLRTIVRSAALSVALLALPFLQAFHATFRAVFEQPTYYPPNHPTPLLSLAPRIGHGVYSAGVGRYFVVFCALATGYWAWTRGLRALWVFWVAGVLFTLRAVCEPVMAPYYVWAATVFLVLVAAAKGAARLTAATLVISAAGLVAYHHASRWGYWLPVVVLELAALAVSYPGRAAHGPSSESDADRVETGAPGGAAVGT